MVAHDCIPGNPMLPADFFLSPYRKTYLQSHEEISLSALLNADRVHTTQNGQTRLPVQTKYNPSLEIGSKGSHQMQIEKC